MKKHIFNIILLCSICLCSCSNGNAVHNDETDFQVTSSDIMTTSDTAAEVGAETAAEISETVSETVPALAFPEDEVIRAYANSVNKTLNDGGGLYDLDFDGLPEYVYRIGGEAATIFYYVYKYINDTPTEVGVMIQDYYGDLLTLTEITLYYDKESDSYFYVSEFAATDKMALSKYAEATRYTFSGDTMTEETLSRCDFDTHWDNELLDFETIDITSNVLLGENTTPIGITKTEDMTSYYDGLSDYLEAFEKIGVFEFECMTDGEYETIYDNLYYNYYINNENKLSVLQ